MNPGERRTSLPSLPGSGRESPLLGKDAKDASERIDGGSSAYQSAMAQDKIAVRLEVALRPVHGEVAEVGEQMLTLAAGSQRAPADESEKRRQDHWSDRHRRDRISKVGIAVSSPPSVEELPEVTRPQATPKGQRT